MREIRDDIARWFNEGSQVALAQVIKTWGSSPRPAGSLMAISSAGQIAGSVSGGCIEGDVVQLALDCLDTNSAQREAYHASTDVAQSHGLSCGGEVEVFVSPLSQSVFEEECHLLDLDCEYLRLSVVSSQDEQAVGVVTFKTTETTDKTNSPKTTALSKMLCEIPKSQQTGVLVDDGTEFFFSRKTPNPLLVCIGGVHIAIYLTQLAKSLGYRTIVIDPRRIFSTPERFPFVDELMHEWPQKAFETIKLNAASAVCALTHDPKIDVPALSYALESPAFYIGSLGRYTTQLSRYTELRKRGYNDSEISRVFGPIGLDLGSKNPLEIALAIMAEITAVKNGCVQQGSTKMLSSAQQAREEKLLIESLSQQNEHIS